MTDLPKKEGVVEKVPMSARQSEMYYQMVQNYKTRAEKVSI